MDNGSLYCEVVNANGRSTSNMRTAKSEITALVDQLSVIDEDIRHEAVRQPALFIEAVRYRVSRMRIRSQAEAMFEAFVSRRGLVVRARVQGSKERVTEGAIKARVQKHPKFKLLQSALADAEAEEEFSKLLLEAFRMRRDAIKILADAQNYEAGRSVMDLERKDVTRKLSNEARRVQQARRHKDN